MHGAIAALRSLAGRSWSDELDGAALLGERATIAGSSRRGSVSVGGTCRLLATADGRVAVNLPRPDDLASLAAWLGEGDTGDPWRFVGARLASLPTTNVIELARLLGLAVGEVVDPPASAAPWIRVAAEGPGDQRDRHRAPLVLDLSSLWAGPLCGHLLGLAGARIIKVESTGRPDGARAGPAAFFDLINAGKQSAAFDFRSPTQVDLLKRLIVQSDIVIESARPRALAQIGIDAEAIVAEGRGKTWVSITGYGRDGERGQWIAFGDDAAAAAGLAVAAGSDIGTPVFCADAVADPLTGAHAAVAALAAWHDGGGRLLDMSLRDVSAHALAFGAPDAATEVRRADGGWQIAVDGDVRAVAPPRARAVTARARPLGADTRAVLAERVTTC
jgi:hypothetical protein